MSAEGQKAQIIRLLDAAKRCGLNALMVQVRPESDALYESSLEPWSRFLSGAQGKNPGYDPLQAFIDEGRKRNIAIHAWINPFRASAGSGGARASTHITRRLPDA